MKISASDQVQLWLAGLPPETKKKVRFALKDLATGSKHLHTLPLRRELEGFYRLRVGNYRITYHLETSRHILLDYADLRDEVYEAFKRLQAIRELHND
jgi:mRNA-degrading endonuclease RelE of RelBE toxin-antitoxin system